jgi:hypothetical protein
VLKAIIQSLAPNALIKIYKDLQEQDRHILIEH